MGFLNTTSLIAAFLAGVAALFAPCCITVLLPSYLASIFRQRATVFVMTFVFFLGLLTVFLPIGLSFGVVGRLVSSFHDPIFLLGGLFLLLLGFFILSGFHFSLPFSVNPTLQKVNPLSVYVLGIFSGLATTCCAPVLAGVMALSVLPASVFWAGAYTVSYVLGMTIPLFILAVILDKSGVEKKIAFFRKRLDINFFGKKANLAYSEVVSGAVFVAMGFLIIYLTLTGNLTTHASYQLSINLFVARSTILVNRYLGFIPQSVWALFFVILIFVLVVFFRRKLKEDFHGEKTGKF